MNRFTARIGSLAAALLVLLLCIAPAHVRAQSQTTYVFDAYSVGFADFDARSGTRALAINDAGLAALLYRLHATLSWKPGARSALISTAQPSVVSFTAGDLTYNSGSVVATARVAPYMMGSVLYVPLDSLLQALYLKPVQSGAMTYLQPQIGSVDVQAKGAVTRVTAFSSVRLHPRLLERLPNAMAYAFEGVGTSLVGSQPSHLPGLRAVTIVQRGTATNPVTIVRLELSPGATVAVPGSDDGRDAVLSIASADTAAVAAVTSTSPSNPAPQGASISATVTGVNAVGDASGYSMMIQVTGNTSYEWHRLHPPDNRFWVDIRNAQLHMAPAEYAGGHDVQTIRIRQVDPQTVRIALSLDAEKHIDVTPTPQGLTITVSTQDALADDPHAGVGPIGNPGTVVAMASPYPQVAAQTPWKFGYVPTNPRLIVIDPGHGGSDRGAVRDGVSEAALNLDMAHRLRDVLVARGWQVILTHSTDVDVYGPDASAHDELQARDDIANNAGARLLISIHSNAFINDGPSGTTTYYAKAEDLALARDVQSELAARLGVKNDGIIKSHFYVPLHAKMPAVLVETAFLSNPSDFRKLRDPQWRELVAQSLADAIAEYAGAPPATQSQGDTP